MRTETITVYKTRPWKRPKGEWRWRWKAANGLTIGSSSEGYANRAECIANLERISGGSVELRYTARRSGGPGEFCQGIITWGWTAGQGRRDAIFVQVTP